MKNEKSLSKGPGVIIPPPLFYVLFYFTAVFIQKHFPINNSMFQFRLIKIPAVLFFAAAAYFIFSSLILFYKTKNTVVLIKRATSLQTSGVYRLTRNPMYLGLALVYLAVVCLDGNWWHIILFPLLILFIQEYIIRKEEKYLELEFGTEYLKYKQQVRRWI